MPSDKQGGTNLMPPSFDPALRLFFVTARETCATYTPEKQVIVPGRGSTMGTVLRDATKAYGALRAIDATTGERRWKFKYQSPTFAGLLSTGRTWCSAATTKATSWRSTPAREESVALPDRLGDLGRVADDLPVDGRQHVIIGAGTTITAFALPGN